ncbi:unnamed protein product [Tetraodon nigroviridis]|uniref:(spotted green pufferfish) hypothetical protein n=1 Tax=Tetraodon nigroviridis TaxID=99883 RepID=Q4SY20_TETNG|nr:unnamed protein product [Tetraodon nigroviridis]
MKDLEQQKKNGQRKIIHSLWTGSGSEISDSSEIRKYAAGFYKDLYRSEWSSNPAMQASFFRGLPQVSDDTNAGLAAEVTQQELHTATLSLQNGKAPGIDGLPVEFYKSFWDVIGGDLLEKSAFKVWGMLLKRRQEQADSAYWLQQEPVLWGTKLDIPNQMNGTITRRMRTTGIVNLGQETTGKTFYKMMVKSLNKQGLNQRADMPWRRHLHLAPDCRPQWRALYKPPLSKRHADLHWRVLHGIFPVNSFVSTINKTVEDKCPFCDQRETIFHCFYECQRLLPLFSFLQNVFLKCEEFFTKQSFILGFKYTRHQKNKCQLLNFVLGQAKMAVYLSRKKKIEEGFIVEPVVICINMIKSRLLINFNFQKAAGDLDSFIQVWGFNNVLCQVVNNSLQFGDALR